MAGIQLHRNKILCFSTLTEKRKMHWCTGDVGLSFGKLLLLVWD